MHDLDLDDLKDHILEWVAKGLGLGELLELIKNALVAKIVDGYVTGKGVMLALVFGIMAIDANEDVEFFYDFSNVDRFFTEARDLLFSAVGALVIALVSFPEAAAELSATTAGRIFGFIAAEPDADKMLAGFQDEQLGEYYISTGGGGGTRSIKMDSIFG